MKTMWVWLRRAGIGLAVIVAVSIPAGMWLWQDRDSLDAIDLPTPEPTQTGADAVTATWLGVSTLLFDDGDTQLLVDGFFSRPGILDIVFRRPIVSDAANINLVLDKFRMHRLAAIVPTHSHYDHAMDVGAIANRTSASVVGTESTANISRGADVPDDQIVLATNGDSFTFGNFTVSMITSRHVPNGPGDSHLFAGFMSEPVRQPAAFTRWREGGSWSIVIGHPKGTTLVQGSAGFIENSLAEARADVVMLSVAGLHRQGRDYARAYWDQLVGLTGASRAFVIHHDDFTRPFGQIQLLPKVLDNVAESTRWLTEFAEEQEPSVTILRPVFGEPFTLY